MNSSINRALIFQGGGSLGAYEAGAYKAIKEGLSARFRKEGRENDPLFHIVSGTSIGAINAALLVSYVKENKTWEGSGERLIEFWEYLSTQSLVENIDASSTALGESGVRRKILQTPSHALLSVSGLS